MKKTVLGIVAVTIILAAAIYFFAESSPYYTDTNRTFTAQDAAIAGIIQRSCFSKDSTRLVTVPSSAQMAQGRKAVFLWDLEKEEQILSLQPQLFGFDLAISPNNLHIALNEVSGTELQVVVHETETGNAAATIPVSPKSGAWEIEFLPDGETLIVTDGASNITAKVWNWKEEKLLRSFPCSGYEMEVSEDGKQIVTGGRMVSQHNQNDDKARLWDVQTGKLLHELPGHKQGATRFAYSPDGAFVVTGGSTPIVRIWDASSGALVRSLDAFPNENRGVSDIAFTHDGKHLAVAYGAAPPKRPTGSMGQVLYLMLALLSIGRTRTGMVSPVILYDCGTWRPLRQYGLNELNATISFPPDDACMITVDIMGKVRWWDLP